MKLIACIIAASLLLLSCHDQKHEAGTQTGSNPNTSENTTIKADTGMQPGQNSPQQPGTVSVTKTEDISFANGRRPDYLQAKPFYIRGTVVNGAYGNVILDRLTIGKVHPLFTQTMNAKGEFDFEGNISQPELMQFRLPVGFIHFIVRPGDTLNFHLTLDQPGNFQVTGSLETLQLQDMYDILEASNDKKDALEENIKKTQNKQLLAHLYEIKPAQYQQIEAEKQRNLIAFINKADTSFAGLLAALYLQPLDHSDVLEQLDKKYAKRYRDSEFYKALHEKVLTYAPITIGHFAPELLSTTPDGKTIRLSSLKGKYIILDFWASWCEPCRQESSSLRRVYEKFKPKGLEILSYSLDKDRNAWLRAIKDDNRAWINASDQLEYKSPAVTTYLVSAIPATFLIDREGRIVARNLHGDELTKRVAQLIK